MMTNFKNLIIFENLYNFKTILVAFNLSLSKFTHIPKAFPPFKTVEIVFFPNSLEDLLLKQHSPLVKKVAYNIMHYL